MAAFIDAFYWLLDLLLHVDVKLLALVDQYGHFVYVLLFLVIFCETGLVVTPFLPGDSLLFAAGAIAGTGRLSYPLLLILIFVAAMTGDQANYSIGRFMGYKVFERDYRFLKRRHLMAAHDFYERHGGKAIILARFVPIIRTFAPFVAGVAHMRRSRFLLFNCTGAVIWVAGLVTAGFFLGSLPWVQENFAVIIYGIVAVSVLPVVIEATRSYFRSRRGRLVKR